MKGTLKVRWRGKVRSEADIEGGRLGLTYPKR